MRATSGHAVSGRLAIVIAVATTVAGCGSSGTPQLMHLRSSSYGPDEFGIVPTKPLQMPENLSALPAPTPGGSNLTDPTPEADAIAALGGKQTAPGKGVPASDAALVASAGRFGTDGTIRSELSSEDAEYRRHHKGRFLERLFGATTYFEAYAPMSLNQEQELERWRKVGMQTPAAPASGKLQKAIEPKLTGK